MAKRATTEKSHHKPYKPTGERGRSKASSSAIPKGVQDLLKEMMPHIEKCYPEQRCCALIGLDYGVWEGYCARYPALRLAIKTAQARKMAEWQDTVEKGSQGWQAAMTLLERLDPHNFSRTAVGRPANTKTPYTAAMQKRKGRG